MFGVIYPELHKEGAHDKLTQELRVFLSDNSQWQMAGPGLQSRIHIH